MRAALPALEVAASVATLPVAQTALVPIGRSGPTGQGSHVELPAFGADPRTHNGVPARLRRRIDRFAAVAYLAIAELLAELPAERRPVRERIGLFLANTRAGWSYGEPELGLLVDEGPAAMHAYQATAWFPAAAQGEVSIGLDLRGCAKTAAGRRAGFGEALWLARDALERGAVDLAITGAVESLVNGFVLRDWPPERLLSLTGPAEGAVVFALRRPEPDGARRTTRLRDLWFTPESEQVTETEWAPTLSGASRLHDAVGGVADGTDVPLGGGFSITVDHPKTSTHTEES
jgi:hypothetical protein